MVLFTYFCVHGDILLLLLQFDHPGSRCWCRWHTGEQISFACTVPCPSRFASCARNAESGCRALLVRQSRTSNGDHCHCTKLLTQGVKVTYLCSLTRLHHDQSPVIRLTEEPAYSYEHLHKMNRPDLCCGIQLLSKTVPPNIPENPRYPSSSDPTHASGNQACLKPKTRAACIHR